MLLGTRGDWKLALSFNIWSWECVNKKPYVCLFFYKKQGKIMEVAPFSRQKPISQNVEERFPWVLLIVWSRLVLNWWSSCLCIIQQILPTYATTVCGFFARSLSIVQFELNQNCHLGPRKQVCHFGVLGCIPFELKTLYHGTCATYSLGT